MHFELYRTLLRQWRWRLRAVNGEIIASGESFRSKAACINSIGLVKSTSTKTKIEELK